jgi:hypothetical protein
MNFTEQNSYIKLTEISYSLCLKIIKKNFCIQIRHLLSNKFASTSTFSQCFFKIVIRTVCLSGTLMSIYESTRRHDPELRHLHCRENLRSHEAYSSLSRRKWKHKTKLRYSRSTGGDWIHSQQLKAEVRRFGLTCFRCGENSLRISQIMFKQQ